MLYKNIFRLMSPGGAKGRLTTLIFHRVLPAPDPLFPGEVCAEQFAAICNWISSWFNVLPLQEAVESLRVGTLPERALSITFDDGYADNHEVALPILKAYGLTATFFVSTGFLNGGRMWNDSIIESIRRTKHSVLEVNSDAINDLPPLPLETLQDRRIAIDAVIRAIKYLPIDKRSSSVLALAEAAEAELPTDLMMTSDQVRSLHASGMTLGPHTVSHPILATLSADAAAREIQESKLALEEIIKAPSNLFAYPNGKPTEDYNSETVRIVQELGFKAAVSTSWGIADRTTSIWEIPRFTPWDRTRTRFALRLARQLFA